MESPNMATRGPPINVDRTDNSSESIFDIDLSTAIAAEGKSEARFPLSAPIATRNSPFEWWQIARTSSRFRSSVPAD